MQKISIQKNLKEDERIKQLKTSHPEEYVNLFYQKYAPGLFGYIFSLVKNQSASETLFLTVFTELLKNEATHSIKGSLLLQGIQLANRTILDINPKERQSFFMPFTQSKQIRNN